MSEDMASPLRQRKVAQKEDGRQSPTNTPSSPQKHTEEVVWGKTPNGEGELSNDHAPTFSPVVLIYNSI